MSAVFMKIVNMSISASWLILAVLFLRLLLKKAPKWTHVLMWGIVAVRLICPFSIESALSLLPSAETISTDMYTESRLHLHTGITSVDNRINSYVSEQTPSVVPVSVNNGQKIMHVLAVLWLVGVVLFAMYTVFSYIRLRYRVSTAILLREQIYQSEMVSTPFVLGTFRPRIYVPFDLKEPRLSYVLSHEQAHLKRGDHWWKPLGFALLVIHWMNPLMWLAYVLLCRDIEQACDEKVIQQLGTAQRADYSETLLFCSTNRKRLTACPLAFGEVSVKERVKSVLSYRKPTVWMCVIAMVLCSVVAVCFLTNPKAEDKGSDLEQPGENSAETGELLAEFGSADINHNGKKESFRVSQIDPFVYQLDVVQEQETIAVDEASVWAVMNRIVVNYGLENAMAYEDRVSDTTQDAVVLLCQSASGKYTAYGFISPEYGMQGILIDNMIDGESNWNYFYDYAWAYGNNKPTLEEQGAYNVTFTYTKKGGTEQEVPFDSFETGTLSESE